MHKCLNCGTEFEGNFCPECGTHKNDGKNCRQCGKLLPKNAKFCTECGYSFLGELPAENARAEDEKTAAPAAREIAAASAPVQPAQPQQESYARAPLLNADLLRAAHGAALHTRRSSRAVCGARTLLSRNAAHRSKPFSFGRKGKRVRGALRYVGKLPARKHSDGNRFCVVCFTRGGRYGNCGA